MAHDVFISHSTKDKVTADAVCAVLESHGIRCWIAPRDIIPGNDWGESIVAAIKGARIMVLVLSGYANESVQIKREVERAVSKGVPVIPMRIEDVVPSSSLEYFISSSHWLDAFSPPLEKHLQYLAGVVQQILGQPIKPAPNFPPRTAPEENLPRRSSRSASEDGPAAAPTRAPPPPPPLPYPSFREANPAPSHRRIPSRRVLVVAALVLVGVALGISYENYRARSEPEGRFHQVTSKLRSLLP